MSNDDEPKWKFPTREQVRISALDDMDRVSQRLRETVERRQRDLEDRENNRDKREAQRDKAQADRDRVETERFDLLAAQGLAELRMARWAVICAAGSGVIGVIGVVIAVLAWIFPHH